MHRQRREGVVRLIGALLVWALLSCALADKDDGKPDSSLDEVLKACNESGTLWDAIVSNPNLKIIEEVYKTTPANVTAVLASPTANLTVFVPSDKALLRYMLDEGWLNSTTSAVDQVTEVVHNQPAFIQEAYILYNMLYGQYRFESPPRDPIPLETMLHRTVTSEGGSWQVPPIYVKPGPEYSESHPCDRQTYVQGVAGDFGCIVNTTLTCNGVMHVINGIALPANSKDSYPQLKTQKLTPEMAEPSNATQNYTAVLPQYQTCSGQGGKGSIWEIVNSNNNTTLTAAAILHSHSGLDTVLNSAGINLTFFVPINAYFPTFFKNGSHTDGDGGLGSFDGQGPAPREGPPDRQDFQGLVEDALNASGTSDPVLFLSNQSFIPPSSIFNSLLYYLVPGSIDIDAESSTQEVDTLLDYFAVSPPEELVLKFVPAGNRDGVYGVGGTATKGSPAGVVNVYEACNGHVYLFDYGTILAADNLTSVPKTSLDGSITMDDVRTALNYYNVPYDNTNSSYLPDPNDVIKPPSPSPATQEDNSGLGVAIAVPVTIAGTLLVLAAVLVAWMVYRKRKRQPKVDRSNTQQWLDGLGESDDEDAPPGRRRRQPHNSNSKGGEPEASSFVGNLLQHSAQSLLGQLLARENAEARKLREVWEICAEEIEMLHGPDGTRKKLGAGGFGEVYQGVWNGATPVAVKFICPHISKEEHIKTLYKEISVLKDCRNNNIVQFYGACLHDNDMMLVTEYMPLGDLFHALQGPRGPIYRWKGRGKYIALDIIRGLVYLHSRKIVHCDMKSPNILLGQSGNAKIGDMGMSRVLAKASVTKSQSVGTWSWAAPELLLNSRINEQVDVYSFGIILWEIVTGSVPQRGCMRDFRVPEECSQGVADLYEHCIEADPHMRPTAKEVARELIRIIKKEREEERALASEQSQAGASDLTGLDSVDDHIESFMAVVQNTPSTAAFAGEGSRHGSPPLNAPSAAAGAIDERGEDGAAAVAVPDAADREPEEAKEPPPLPAKRPPLRRNTSINPFKNVLLGKGASRRALAEAAVVRETQAAGGLSSKGLAGPGDVSPDNKGEGGEAGKAGPAAAAAGDDGADRSLNRSASSSRRLFNAVMDRLSFKTNPFKRASEAAAAAESAGAPDTEKVPSAAAAAGASAAMLAAAATVVGKGGGLDTIASGKPCGGGSGTATTGAGAISVPLEDSAEDVGGPMPSGAAGSRRALLVDSAGEEHAVVQQRQQREAGLGSNLSAAAEADAPAGGVGGDRDATAGVAIADEELAGEEGVIVLGLGQGRRSPSPEQRLPPLAEAPSFMESAASLPGDSGSAAALSSSTTSSIAAGSSGPPSRRASSGADPFGAAAAEAGAASAAAEAGVTSAAAAAGAASATAAAGVASVAEGARANGLAEARQQQQPSGSGVPDVEVRHSLGGGSATAGGGRPDAADNAARVSAPSHGARPTATSPSFSPSMPSVDAQSGPASSSTAAAAGNVVQPPPNLSPFAQQAAAATTAAAAANGVSPPPNSSPFAQQAAAADFSTERSGASGSGAAWMDQPRSASILTTPSYMSSVTTSDLSTTRGVSDASQKLEASGPPVSGKPPRRHKHGRRVKMQRSHSLPSITVPSILESSSSGGSDDERTGVP